MNDESLSIWEQLAEPFPLEATHWRVGSVTKDKKRGVALAYIDARDVMDRLDRVVGPENWQDHYEETPSGRVICTITIRHDANAAAGDGPYTVAIKSDGAGDTSYEGAKGAISDAFKRAAVKFGVGRYLYSLSAPWVEIDKGRIKESEMESLNKELTRVIGIQTWGDRNHANMFRALKVAMEAIPVDDFPAFVDRAEQYLKQLKVGYKREIHNEMNRISSSRKEAA
jgi:hypothetical protein